MALPRGTTGSLSPTFVPAPLVGVAVRLPSAFALFERFPTVLREPLGASVLLGGDRPSQTAHLTMSCDQIHGRQLEFQYCQGGIPRLTPPRLTPWFPSLPPILYRQYQNSMLSYSKALRGLPSNRG